MLELSWENKGKIHMGRVLKYRKGFLKAEEIKETLRAVSVPRGLTGSGQKLLSDLRRGRCLWRVCRWFTQVLRLLQC